MNEKEKQMELNLKPEFLVRKENIPPIEILREDLEDALKEYGGLDLIVEVIQNALDAIDERRYRLICAAANRDPKNNDTITDWNQAVLNRIEEDYEKYSECESPSDRAVFYRNASKDKERREAWWIELADNLGGTADDLQEASNDYDPQLEIIVRSGAPSWIEVIDNGIGMESIPDCFRHKSSDKRSSANRERRLGVRGSHGWGLSAILGLSNRIEVLSKTKNKAPHAYSFSDYASFVLGSVERPNNSSIDLEDKEASSNLSSKIYQEEWDSGTHIRIQAAQLEETDILGHTILNYSPSKFSNLLRMYTPVGQVNDYVMNPSYHNVRRDDINVRLKSHMSGSEKSQPVPFDIFRMSEADKIASQNYSEFVNDGMPSNVSVHTIHRSKRGGSVYLSAAEIQAASLTHEVEDELLDSDALPIYLDENGNTKEEIPRGFRLALSGGMASEYLVRKPRSTSAAFRGYILSETAKPTLGRKYVMDQRKTIPRAAKSHESTFDEERKKVLPKSVSQTTNLKSFKMRVDHFTDIIDDLRSNPPPSSDLQIWAEKHSQEARVMLLFSSLLERGVFGDLRILRAHLQDRYDFAFLYRVAVGSQGAPKSPKVERLDKDGYAKWDKSNNEMIRYGIGEFKHKGETIFNDFDPDDPNKSADDIDLLVCWSFDREVIGDKDWTTTEVDESSLEFQGQTHVWKPQGNIQGRARPLPVVSLNNLIDNMVDQGDLSNSPSSQVFPDFMETIS